MFKLKNSLASALDLTVLVGTMPFQSSAEAIYSTEDGYYTTDAVVAKKYYTPDDNSMCNGVFASDAEVIISGDTATIKLYVANPTPVLQDWPLVFCPMLQWFMMK